MVKAVRSPYRYEVDLNGVIRYYHANKLRKYHVHVESVTYDTSVYCFDNDGISLPVIDEEHGIAIDSCAVVYEKNDDFDHIEPTPLHSSSVTKWEMPSTKIAPESLEYLALEQRTSSESLGFLDAMVHGISLKKHLKLGVG